jgi:hypothetical protein
MNVVFDLTTYERLLTTTNSFKLLEYVVNGQLDDIKNKSHRVSRDVQALILYCIANDLLFISDNNLMLTEKGNKYYTYWFQEYYL